MNDNNEEDIYKVDDDDDYVVKNEKSVELKNKLIKYGIIILISIIILIILIAILSSGKSKNKVLFQKN